MSELIEEAGISKIRQLPPTVATFWMGQRGLACTDPEAPWASFVEVAMASPEAIAEGGRGSPGVGCIEEWMEGVLGEAGAADAFMEARVKPRLTRRGEGSAVTVGDLGALCQAAQLRLRVDRALVDLRVCFQHLLPASASRPGRETGAGGADLGAARVVAAVGAPEAGEEGGEGGSEAGRQQGEEEGGEGGPGPFQVVRDIVHRLEGFMEGSRQWMISRVTAWMDGEGEEGGGRLFLLLANPGMGKTAVMAAVCRELQVSASTQGDTG